MRKRKGTVMIVGMIIFVVSMCIRHRASASKGKAEAALK